MILLTLSRGKGEETVRLQLPASPAEIGETFAFLDRISLDTTATAILDVSSNVPVLYRCLYDVDVEDSEQFQKLQKLAERTEALSPAKAAIFSGALDAECVWNLEGALTVADRLDEYMLVNNVSSDSELGIYLVNKGITPFPDRFKPYINYPPPNPVADDRNDSFTPSPVPDRPEKTSAQWTIWDPWWQEYWVWHGDDEDGYWCDHGWWEFDLDRYSASLSAAMEITPDEKNPTASDSTMKSGYGVNQVVTARVNSSQRSATTALQNAVSYLPEFNYESFWRLLDRMSISSSSSRLEFQKNEYSTYNRRTHFTPIWYPDGSYTVNTWVIDCWTPAGMLSVNLTDSLNIRGNLWDDWHIAPLDL